MIERGQAGTSQLINDISSRAVVCRHFPRAQEGVLEYFTI